MSTSGGYTVVSTMKNEGAFLLEWVAHQKALGFDHIWVATNDCADPTVEMLKRLQELGLARQHDTEIWPRAGIQRSALKQARRYVEVKRADWLFVCDVDEFLVIKTGDGTVQHLAEGAGAHEVVAVAWRNFGSGGLRDYQDSSVTRQFTRAVPDPATYPGFPIDRHPGTFGKSLFKGLRDVQRIGIHGPIAKPELGRDLARCFAGGAPYRQGSHKILIIPDYSVAQVNHYALRSMQSFLVKRDRGRVNHSNDVMGLDYWQRFDQNAQPCDAIRRYDEVAGAWRERLFADATLRELHQKAVDWHRAKIAELSALPDYQALAAAILSGQG